MASVDYTAWRWLGGLAFLAVGVGCGPTSDEDTSDSTAQDDASADEGTADNGASATGLGTGSDEGADETGAPSCEDFESASGAMITLGVTNMTGAPTFLHRIGCNDPIGLSAAEGEPSVMLAFPDCEAPNCDDLLAGNCAVACAGGSGGACQQTVIRIDPGVTHTRTWTGSVWNNATVPTECLPAASGCDSQCFQQSPSAPGAFSISVEFSGCPNEDPASCECPNGEDTCEIMVGVGKPSAMPGNVSIDFEYPTETGPTIIIQ